MKNEVNRAPAAKKIALIGYGKMGHMIEEIALQRGHEIVARIDVNDAFDLNGADVAIEFTTPQTAETNIRKAWKQNIPVVCGSTGWNAQELLNEDKRTHEKTMLVWSSNFSVGVNIFFGLNKYLAEAISNQQSAITYTPSITEIHHIHKLDKPSGTAKTLAEGLRVMGYGLQDSEIESIREGEVPGTHEVKWDSEEDTIIITHIAKGRRGFALGAVLAAESLDERINE
ncbi:MAG: 4-hydroxy-tetrahydrodipicolinate reductase [Paludibacteraceae bacterium]|nr:4-hydroxy-tetrahydrodipicolinate reductase [Paludibacteraceae bacterium]